MTFRTILCPTDFSAGAERAVQHAARISAETGAQLVLLHCWYSPTSVYVPEVSISEYEIQQIADDAQRSLDDATRAALAAGAKNVSGMLLRGVPWAEIVDQLGRQHCDLCVIGTQGRTRIARFMLGSVAEKVVRHAPCSVLTVRPDSPVKPFVHVLVPTDFSESAARAFDLAATLVAPTGSITLLHVLEGPVTWSGDMPIAGFPHDLSKLASAALDKELARFQRTSKVSSNGRSRLGAPGAETLAVLDDDLSIDLVVMGSHGRTGLLRALVGSVAEKVVRHARCPVLVARTRA